MKVAHQRSCWIGCFFTSDQEPGVQLPELVVSDLSTGAVIAMQSKKDSSEETVGAVVQTLETWGHTDVVLHADGEPATKSLVRSVANARVHRTLPRHVIKEELMAIACNNKSHKGSSPAKSAEFGAPVAIRKVTRCLHHTLKEALGVQRSPG